MAGEIKGITVEIGGDTSDLAKALTALNKPIKSTEKELREVEKLLQMDPGNTVALSQKQQLLNQRVDETRKKLETLKAAKKQADDAMDNGTKVNQEEYRKLQREIELTEQELRKATAEAKKFSETGERIKAVGTRIETVGQKVKEATDAFRPLSAAILAVDAAAVKVGADYEKQMSKVQAITTAGTEDMEKLKAATRDIGISAEFVATATEAGEAMEYMGLAGWDTGQIMANLPAVLNTATAAAMDLGETSDIITDYLTAFNMKTDEAARLADVMAYAQSNSNTSIEQLAGAYRNCAANANSMGYEVEEVTADLAMMANQGLKGERAGTALNAVYRDLTQKMKNGAVAINGHTVAVQDQAGNYRKLSDIITDVQGATAGMGTAERNAALMAVFTSESLRGLNLLLNAGGRASAEFAAELRNSSGAAETAAAVMRDNLAGDIDVTKGKLEAAGLEIYDVLEPALRSVVGVAGDVAGAFAEMDSGTQKLIVTAGSLAAAVPLAGTAIAGLTKVAGIAASGLSVLAAHPVVAGVAALTVGVVALTTAFGDEMSAEEKVIAAHDENMKALKEEQQAIEDRKAAQDKAITAALTEAVHLEDLSIELETLVDENGKVKEGYEDRVQYILNELNGAFGTEYKLIDGAIAKYDELKDSLETNIAMMKIQAVMATLEDDYKTAEASIDRYASALTRATDEQERLKTKLAELNAESQKQENFLTDKVEESYYYTETQEYRDKLNAFEELQTKIEATEDAYAKAVEKVKTAQAKYDEAAEDIADYSALSTAAMTGDLNTINGALAEWSGNVVRATDANTKAYESQRDDMKSSLTEMVQNLAFYSKQSGDVGEQGVNRTRLAIESQLEELAKVGGTIPRSIADNLSAAGVQVPDAVVDIMGRTQAAAITSAQEMGGAFGDNYLASLNFGKIATAAAEAAVNIGQSIDAGAAQGMTNNSGAVEQAGASIGKAGTDGVAKGAEVNSPSKATYRTGVFVAQGLALGITAGRSQVINAAANVATAAITAAKKKLEIHSPSQVMKDEVGAMTVAGMAEGIEENRGLVVKAAEGVTAELLTAENRYIQEKERIDKEHAEYDEAQRVKQYEERLANAKTAADRQEIIDEEARRRKEKADDEYLDELKALAEEEKNIAKEREEQAKKTVDTYADMVQAVIDDYEDMEAAIDKAAEKLQDYRSDTLYRTNTIEDKDGNEVARWYDLPDLSESTDNLKEYYELLVAVKEKGADTEVFDVLRGMDVDEGITYATVLLDATDEEFDRYMAQWQDKRETSQQIAALLYADEAEAITTNLEAALSESMSVFAEYGYDAGEEFMENFRQSLEPLRDIVNFMNNHLYGGSIDINGGSATGGNTVNYNVTQNITGTSGSPAENAAAISRWIHTMEVTGMMGG